MDEKIPRVVGRNWHAMSALKRRDRNSVITSCRRDEDHITFMLGQIQKQFDQVLETLRASREFVERVESDDRFFAEVCEEACREANKP